MILSPMDAYRSDLAHIHDDGFGWFAEKAGPGVLEMLRKAGIRDGLVVDLGSGSGIWARRLVDAGYDVRGIDISTDMVDMARERVPEAEFVAGSLLQVDIPACVAVTSMGECLNYLFDESAGPRGLRRLFRRVFDALPGGGLFVFDIAEPGRDSGNPARRHWQTDDWAVLIETGEDPGRGVLTREITTFRRHGETFRREHETHRLRLYRGTDVADELRRVGFRARTLRSYGRFRLLPGLVALRARKP